jgi:hypothetical protein
MQPEHTTTHAHTLHHLANPLYAFLDMSLRILW